MQGTSTLIRTTKPQRIQHDGEGFATKQARKLTERQRQEARAEARNRKEQGL